DVDRRFLDGDALQYPAPENVPRHGKALGPIAQVPRLVVEDTGDLGAGRGDAARRRRLQRVVALIRVELPELVAEHGLVVDSDRAASDDVVGEVDRTAEMRFPRKGGHAAVHGCGGQMK